MAEKIDDLVASILENVSTDTTLEVELPSRGIGYSSDSGTVRIKAMSFADEKSAAQTALSQPNFDHISFILSRCISGVDPEELYLFDKVFLILKLRQATYGDEFKGEVTCPKCEEVSVINFDLHKVPVTFVEDDFCDPKEITLPKSQRTCKVFVPRTYHEKLLKSNKSTMENLWRFVHSIEGHENKEVVAKVLEGLPLPDINFILRSLIKNYGIDTKIMFMCGGCGHKENMEMPFNADFFIES